MKRNVHALSASCTTMFLYLLGLLIGITCAWSGWRYKQMMYLQYHTTEKHFHAIVDRYLAVNEEERLVREFYPYVLELHEQGVIGQEPRLDWIETLQRAGKHLDLSVLNYRIGVQEEYMPSARYKSNYRIYYSPMRLDIDLLHEGDLFELFAELDGHAPGIYTVSSCRLSRLRREINHAAIQDNIRTECELLWFSIKKLDGGTIDLT